MSANRKLQSEVQQVFKKIEEGILLFDDIWEKVYAAREQNLKEKYEGDLKKEIKKLQRLRDQIKVWLSGSDIKDKGELTEARKKIETKMEQFKICEKDTKTKAYSNEGIMRASRNDPREAEKQDKMDWINACLEKLQDLLESIEAEVEKLSNGKGKGKNKDQMESFENRIKKIKWHMSKLEQIMRLIDNDALDPSKIDSIKEDIEYYIDSANDDDGELGVDDEFDIYEELQLDSILNGDLDDVGSSAPTSSAPVAEGISADVDSKKPVVVASASVSTSASAGASKVTVPVAKAGTVPIIPGSIASVVPATTGKASIIPPKAPSTAAAVTSTTTKAVTSTIGSPRVAATTVASVVSKDSTKKSPQLGPADSISSETNPSNQSAAPKVETSWAAAASTPANVVAPPAVNRPPVPPVVNASSIKSEVPSTASLQSSPPQPPLATVPTNQVVNNTELQRQQQLQQLQQFQLQQAATANASRVGPGGGPGGGPVGPSSFIGMQGNRVNHGLNEGVVSTLHMLKQSMVNCPEIFEPDKPVYTPRNPYNVHQLFPSTVPPQLEVLSVFEKLPPDSLFLAFYFQQGSFQQHLAAKVLKKNSWRFHKKYMTWFQRVHDDQPKVVNDDYEEGTYVYFDYEGGWCQRIKQEFKFEYAYLEDDSSTQFP